MTANSVIQGYVYVLQNRALKQGLYKIGMTTRTAEDRAWEIYAGATGVPAPYEVAFTFPVTNCVVAEARIHAELATHRFNEGREFFEVSISKAVSVIERVGNAINIEFPAALPKKIKNDEWTIMRSNSSNSRANFANNDLSKTLLLKQEPTNAITDSKDISVYHKEEFLDGSGSTIDNNLIRGKEREAINNFLRGQRRNKRITYAILILMTPITMLSFYLLERNSHIPGVIFIVFMFSLYYFSMRSGD